MTNSNQKKQIVKKNEINPIRAAITGAIVGAGVAIAGTIALEDKKNREKVKQIFTDVKDRAVGYIERMQEGVKDKENMKKQIAGGKKEIKKIINSTIKKTEIKGKKKLATGQTEKKG